MIIQSRALMDAEVAAVLEAARRAVEGRIFRLSYTPTGPGIDIQMGPAGRPRYIRMLGGREGHADTVTFLHYTGTAARGCDGVARAGELVLEYEHKGSTWTVKARTRSGVELNDAAFGILQGRQPLTSGPVERVGDAMVVEAPRFSGTGHPSWRARFRRVVHVSGRTRFGATGRRPSARLYFLTRTMDQCPTIVKLMFTTSFTETTPPTLTGFIPYSVCLTGKRPVAVSVLPSILTLTGTVISWATPRIVS
jgi:hypothetical protein